MISSMHEATAVTWHSEHAKVFDRRYSYDRLFRERFEVWSNLIAKYSDRESSAMDLGCGSGVFSFLLAAENRDVLAIDASAEMIAMCDEKLSRQPTENLTFRCEDIRNIDAIVSHPVDLMICSSVLEYVDDLDACIGSCVARLNTMGVLLVSFPNRSSLYRIVERYAFAATGYPKYYRFVHNVLTVGELSKRCQDFGLKLLETKYFGYTGVLSPIARKLGIAEYSDKLFLAAFRKSRDDRDTSVRNER